MTTAQLIAAIAASLAAVFSGIGLWLGVVREERKWRREVLVDTLVQLLDASFASPGEGLMSKRRAGTLSADDWGLVEQAHQSAITALTRLRVLAPVDVVDEAEQLHMIDDEAAELVLSLDSPLPEALRWTELLNARRDRRVQLLNAARRHLGLGRAKPIHPGRPRHPPNG